ncbi:helix-turn-helix domain-containing protein [Gilvimarinus sp. SDUM040013]|uniref:Helix-turn-helix domain-containing protein n=1 Tax=Gilvimarinus gilvus TaxID=3058038 RepID=A0ABU4S4R9_9GAMM|nr:helix-turn-helix domain-containing protein [Gilvimarinus sp. SDUM040013]MDO3388141.1 helix-turn-helix domain-containing protein [Gilvimarinus sp. SDUM040013]MDX6850284.1 helix-turn-helix domain-containing protein [Gilvimarinus sp. SDUM040013]
MNKAISSEKYNRLIQKLKSSRLEQGLSMRDVAILINEPHSFVQKLEAAEKRLDVYQFTQYCKALNLNPSELIKLLM